MNSQNVSFSKISCIIVRSFKRGCDLVASVRLRHQIKKIGLDRFSFSVNKKEIDQKLPLSIENKDYISLFKRNLHFDKPVRLICSYPSQFYSLHKRNVTEQSNASQHRQIELAKLYGIEGFCFNSSDILEQPIIDFLKDRNLDFPFCLCLENEKKITPTLLQYVRDPRYIRIDGKLLLLINQPDLVSVQETARHWHEWGRQNGMDEIYLVYTQSFEFENPIEDGLDAVIEFCSNNFLKK